MTRTALALTILALTGCGAAETGTASKPASTEDAAATPAKTKKPKPKKPKTIDSGTASGDYAIAQADGTIAKPGTIKVTVTSKPPQKVQVSWTMVCAQEDGAGSTDGQFNAQTPKTRTLRKPAKKVSDCTVAANAQMSEGGRVTVKILG